jgi:hypothetical protein
MIALQRTQAFFQSLSYQLHIKVSLKITLQCSVQCSYLGFWHKSTGIRPDSEKKEPLCSTQHFPSFLAHYSIWYKLWHFSSFFGWDGLIPRGLSSTSCKLTFGNMLYQSRTDVQMHLNCCGYACTTVSECCHGCTAALGLAGKKGDGNKLNSKVLLGCCLCPVEIQAATQLYCWLRPLPQALILRLWDFFSTSCSQACFSIP